MRYGKIAFAGGFGPESFDRYEKILSYSCIVGIDTESKLRSNGALGREKVRTYIVK